MSIGAVKVAGAELHNLTLDNSHPEPFPRIYSPISFLFVPDTLKPPRRPNKTGYSRSNNPVLIFVCHWL